MKIVAGLGNPGREYIFTRHNLGFWTADELARRWGIGAWQTRFDALAAEYRRDREAEPVLLLKPQTYMNLSGVAVAAALRWYKLSPADLTVIYDDVDLPFGRLRVRTGGSAGGHRGVESIIVHVGAEDFNRVRIGVGRPPGGVDTAAHVLCQMNAGERQTAAAAVSLAADAVECLLAYGPAKAMNQFNR